MIPERIISGGQTGVDRAALDAAIKLQVVHGGWCPRGRRAEDGIIQERYLLRETEGPDYATRTRLNVQDSDATLILNSGRLEGGTSLTVDFAREMDKPCLILDLDRPVDTSVVHDWITSNAVRVLNVAGPRESKRPGIYARAFKVISKVLKELKHGDTEKNKATGY